MAPEPSARTRAFYDHESDEPAPVRRRRAAADWGVNEDIFDRMPSRRFKRTDRRAEHHDEASARFERRVSGPAAPSAGEQPRREDWADAHERRQVAPRRGDWAEADDGHAEPRRDDRDSPRAGESSDQRATQGRRPARRPVESWTAGDEGDVEIEGKRPIQSWLEPERGESRTIVLERSEPADIAEVIAEPRGRKTVTITGHPDRLPVPRSPRPPRTAVERIGARPDRIAGYAVLLGFVLILIAVLTTGQ